MGDLDLEFAELTCPVQFLECRLGAVNLSGAQGSTISFDRSLLSSLWARGLHATQDVRLTGVQCIESVRLGDAKVDGNLWCNGTTFSLRDRSSRPLRGRGRLPTEESAPALEADNLQVGHDMLCNDMSTNGRVHLTGAHVDGRLVCTGARLRGRHGGPALLADRLTVGVAMSCNDGFEARGLVSLVGASVGGHLDCEGGTFINPWGQAALYADFLTGDGNMYCSQGFRANGAVALVGAKIRGDLDLSGAGLGSDAESPALYLGSLEVGERLVMCPAHCEGTVDLRDARCRTFVDNHVAWQSEMLLRGFTYVDILRAPADDPEGWRSAVIRSTLRRRPEDRVAWLSRQPGDFIPQPYEQLASVYRAQGHESMARRVGLAKHRHRRRTLPPMSRVGSAVLDATVGYGYRAWLAGPWLLGVFLAASISFAALYPDGFTTKRGAGEFDPWLYAADHLLPVLSLSQHNDFAPQGLASVLVVTCTVVGWLLTSVFVLSLTGVIRRD
ncbi:hypothetical protein [Geodermatophilus sp. SYSU D01176]